MPMTYEHRAPIQCIFYSRDGKTMKRRMRFLGRESDHQKISFDLTCTQFINYPMVNLLLFITQIGETQEYVSFSTVISRLLAHS